MTKRTLIAIMAAVLLFGVADCVRERPNVFFRATIPGQLGGFDIRGHRRLESYSGSLENWLFPTHAWRLSHPSDSLRRLQERSNLGRLGLPTTVETENAIRRKIETAFSLPPGSLDSYDVYTGDESRIQQTMLISRDRTESYYIAMGYI